MDLRDCPECKARISDKATFCPQCGAPFIKNKKKSSGCLSVVISFLVLMMILGALLPQKPKTEQEIKENEREMDKITAYVLCKTGIESTLKAPRTAQHAGISQSIILSDDTEIAIHSFVDSQNSFGALIRVKYDCTVTKSATGNFVIKDLSVID